MQATVMRVREKPDLRLLAALVGLALLIGLIAAFALRGSVEGNLHKRVERELLGAGIGVTDIEVEGRDVSVTIPSDVNPATVRSQLHHIEGVRGIEVRR